MIIIETTRDIVNQPSFTLKPTWCCCDEATAKGRRSDLLVLTKPLLEAVNTSGGRRGYSSILIGATTGTRNITTSIRTAHVTRIKGHAAADRHDRSPCLGDSVFTLVLSPSFASSRHDDGRRQTASPTEEGTRPSRRARAPRTAPKPADTPPGKGGAAMGQRLGMLATVSYDLERFNRQKRCYLGDFLKRWHQKWSSTEVIGESSSQHEVLFGFCQVADGFGPCLRMVPITRYVHRSYKWWQLKAPGQKDTLTKLPKSSNERCHVDLPLVSLKTKANDGRQIVSQG